MQHTVRHTRSFAVTTHCTSLERYRQYNALYVTREVLLVLLTVRHSRGSATTTHCASHRVHALFPRCSVIKKTGVRLAPTKLDKMHFLFKETAKHRVDTKTWHRNTQKRSQGDTCKDLFAVRVRVSGAKVSSHDTHQTAAPHTPYIMQEDCPDTTQWRKAHPPQSFT